MYSNLPPNNSSDLTLQKFDTYYTGPTEFDVTVLGAIKGYFTKKGFGESAAESIATTIIVQAKTDGYNPMQILDTLKGLSDVELSGLVAEILNYNRLKTSSLGYANKIQTNPEILRNILA